MFKHPDLDVVCLGGSSSTNSAGKLSDIDILTIMRPDDPKHVDIKAIIELGSQLRKFAFEKSTGGVVPVVISTIRLEEAQVAMAELLNPNKTIVPIHWLHYPSIEFASINEPPKLVEGLLRGKPIKGDPQNLIQPLNSVDRNNFANLSGLDWITDSFKVFITNVNNGEFPIQRQPDPFLKKLAMHNLEYFWKWNIVRKALEKETGQSPDNWKDMEKFSNQISSDIWSLASEIRILRHKAEWADVKDVVETHVQTFDFLKNNEK